MQCYECENEKLYYFVDGSGQWEHYTWWNPRIIALCKECAQKTSYDTPESYIEFLDEQLEIMRQELDTDEERIKDVRDLKGYLYDLSKINKMNGILE